MSILTYEPSHTRVIIPCPKVDTTCFAVKVNTKQRYCHAAIICKPQILHYKPIAKPMTNIQYEYNIIKSQGIYKLCKNKLYITLYDTSLFCHNYPIPLYHTTFTLTIQKFPADVVRQGTVFHLII